jgi:hypothetical protein
MCYGFMCVWIALWKLFKDLYISPFSNIINIHIFKTVGDYKIPKTYVML